MTEIEARERIARIVAAIAQERKNKKDKRINVSSLTDTNVAGRLSDAERREILSLFGCKKMHDVLEKLGYTVEGEQEKYILVNLTENNFTPPLHYIVTDTDYDERIKKTQSALDKKYALLKAEFDSVKQRLQEEQDKNKSLQEKLSHYERQESVNSILLQFKEELSSFMTQNAKTQDAAAQSESEELARLRNENTQMKKMLDELAMVLPEKDPFGRSEL